MAPGVQQQAKGEGVSPPSGPPSASTTSKSKSVQTGDQPSRPSTATCAMGSPLAPSKLQSHHDTPHVKYLVVTGGTLSGLGKGTTISSIGVVLKSLGFRVTAIKIDPYLNIDAGTMSPYEHGEVYVLEDGGEVDLDLGNYERFLDVTLTRDHNITTGKIYDRVIRFEREGRYLGKTVQVVPHITNAVQAWVQHISHRSVDGQQGSPDICLIEVGGTVGDIESGMYLEALQQFSYTVGLDNFCLCHVSFVPVMGTVGEQKTKPAQHSVKELRMAGLKPDFIFCRSEEPVTDSARQKIALFGQVPAEHVISVHDVSNIYHVPKMIDDQKFGQLVCKRLSLNPRSPTADRRLPPFPPTHLRVAPSASRGVRDVGGATRDAAEAAVGATSPKDVAVGGGEGGDQEDEGREKREMCVMKSEGAASRTNPPLSVLEIWCRLARRVDEATKKVTIGLVGKYTGLMDSYLSVMKALRHAAIESNTRLDIAFIESSSLEDGTLKTDPEAYEEAWTTLRKVDGVLCPGGFGDRGIIGKSLSARYCRKNNVPYLGICLGMQTAVIDLCRELGYSDANSEEFDPSAENKVVVFMPEVNPNQMGGTMRLGMRKTMIRDPRCLAAKLYDHEPVINERHRHRYEVNIKYVKEMEAAGLKFVGSEETEQRMEIAELENHPFFLCTQYHPEFTSRPLRPNPCFLGFLLASAGTLEDRLARNGGKLLPGINYYDEECFTEDSMAYGDGDNATARNGCVECVAETSKGDDNRSERGNEEGGKCGGSSTSTTTGELKTKCNEGNMNDSFCGGGELSEKCTLKGIEANGIGCGGKAMCCSPGKENQKAK